MMTRELFEAIKAKSKPTLVEEVYWSTRWTNGADRALEVVKERLGQDYLGWLYGLFKGHHVLDVIGQVGCDIRMHDDSVRKSLDALGWQFVTTGSRWHQRLPPARQHPCFGIAPVESLGRLVAYHVTEKERWSRIFKEGLLPSNPAIAASDFPDTEGRIHVCGHFDKGREGATYWVKLLSEKRKRNESDYIIIEVDLRCVPGARIHQDMHSKSGLVVDGVDRIPRNALRKL